MASLVLCLVFLIGWIVGAMMGRREEARLIRLIRSQEEHIEKLNGDQLVLLDERNRYKGALEAMSPPPGVAYFTRIVRNTDSVEAAIRKLIRDAGGC